MQALVYRGRGQAEFVHDRPRYEPGAGWARIRMLRAGICGTDLELLEGYKEFHGVPGHEFVGVVESCRQRPALEGQRVVGEINVACGECATCRRGHRTHCERRRVLGILGLAGAFAEYLLLPIENLALVPDGVTDEEATFVEPLAAAVEDTGAGAYPADGSCLCAGRGADGAADRAGAGAAGLRGNDGGAACRPPGAGGAVGLADATGGAGDAA